MQRSPAILGACAAALLTGAVAGQTINTTPLGPTQDNFADATATDPAAYPRFATTAATGPDHYPLITRQGVVPVEDLMFHGRLRSQERAWQQAAYQQDDAMPVPEDAFFAIEEPARAERRTDQPRLTANVQPVSIQPADVKPLAPLGRQAGKLPGGAVMETVSLAPGAPLEWVPAQPVS